jgi:hypothetical protein
MELSLDLIKYMLSDQAGNGNGDDFLIGLALAGASTRVVTDSPQAGPYNALPRKQVSSAWHCLALRAAHTGRNDNHGGRL